MSYVNYSGPGEALFKDIRLDADTNPHHDWPHPPSSLWPLGFCRCQVLFLVLVLAQAFICLHLSGLARPRLLFFPRLRWVKRITPCMFHGHFPSIFGAAPNIIILVTLI